MREAAGEAYLISNGKKFKARSGYLLVRQRVGDLEGAEKLAGARVNVLDLDRSPKLHKRMHLSKSNTPARFVHFIICKLYIKKKTVNKLK